MDNWLFRAFNYFAGRYQLIDGIMLTFSKKVRYLFFFLLVVMWFQNTFHKKITLNALISVGVSMLLNKRIKRYYFKPRPFLKHSVHLLPPSPSKKNSSFPSKHTIIAFAAATSVLFYHRTLGRIMCVAAVFAGFSRIWMGQHYPSDIAGSALLGGLASLVVKLTGEIWNPAIEGIIQTYNRFCSGMKHRLWNAFTRNSEWLDLMDPD